MHKTPEKRKTCNTSTRTERHIQTAEAARTDRRPQADLISTHKQANRPRKPHPHMPVISKSQRDPIIDVVKGANFASPDPEKPFLPIRAGHMKVLQLLVVDAFGKEIGYTR